MTQRDALLRAVCENPDDDLPRLVFADWCDENGEPERAEFIRAHVQAGKSEVFFDHSGYDGPAKRAKELLGRHGVRWMEGVPTVPGVSWQWKRGFPGWLAAHGWQPLKRVIPLAVGRWPVEHLEVNTLTDRGAVCLAADPFGGRIRYLRVYGFRTMAALERLLEGPFAAGLTHLCLRYSAIGDRGAWVVSNAASLRHLKYLNIDCCQIGDSGVRALCRSPVLPNRLELSMERNAFGEELEKPLAARFPSAGY